MVFSFLRNQTIDVIECPEQNDTLIAWKFPVTGNEIKNGAQLTVREGQIAVFINEGQIADVFKAGLHTLNTSNLPILTKLGAWKHGFNSPFKSDVIFLSARELRNFKWGTQQPITLRDADFGIVRVRSFGSFGLKIIDAKDFIRECAGIRDSYSKEDIEKIIRIVVVSKFTDALAEMKTAVIDIATKYEELSLEVSKRISRSFDNYGIELTNFIIESVNLPEEIQKAIDEQSTMNLMMNNSKKFAEWQVLKSMPDAMKNNSSPLHGMASDIAMGQVIGQIVSNTVKNTTKDSLINQENNSVQNINTDTKFCQECGNKVTRSAKFCPECGFKF